MTPNAIYWAWMHGTMEVLVPRRDRRGWMAVPAGHNATKRISALEDTAGCDVCGLDGTLSFDCGTEISVYLDRRREFESRVLPVVSKLFAAPMGYEVPFDAIDDAMFSR